MASHLSKICSLASAFLLAACTGTPTTPGDANLELSGSITQLVGELVLSDGNGATKTFYENGRFSFAPSLYKSESTYKVTVVKQPAEQTCDVANGTGTFSNANATNVAITCRYTKTSLGLSGQAFNLVAPVTLTNERKNTITVSKDGAFSFSPYDYKNGDQYNVAIATTGVKQTCKIYGETGIFANSDINSVQLFCYPRTDLVPLQAEILGLKGALELDVQPELGAQTVKGQNGAFIATQLGELPLNTEYTVAVKTQPEDQSCAVIEAKGVITAPATFLYVQCKDTSFKYTIAGSVAGNFGTLKLEDGLGGSVTVDGDKPFSFGPYKNGSQYKVAITHQPDDTNCSIINASGSLDANISNISVVCKPVGIFLAGTAAGIATPITLTDGNKNQLTVKQDGSFHFAAKYNPGGMYSVAVEDVPEGQACNVVYGKGVFENTGVFDVQVICHAKDTRLNACGAPVPTADPQQFMLKNKVANFGEGLGVGGFSAFDANLNGIPEVLFGQGSGFGRPKQFSVIEFNPASNGFDTLCSSEQFDSTIAKVIAFKNGKYRAASLIAFEQGEIQIINHTSGAKVAQLQTAMTISDIAVGDVDNDGNPEIAVLSETSLALYDANSLLLKQKVSLGGKALAIGHFTQNTKNEVAINSGLVLQFASAGYKTLWDNTATGFGNTFVAAGDIDGDGLDEIVAGDRWYAIRAFNGDNRGILWEMNPGLDISALRVFDTNNDGVSEVLYGDGQHGSTHILKGVDGKREQSYSNPNSGVTDIYVANLDNDNNMELIRGTGFGTTADDFLDVIDLGAQKTQWINSASSGTFRSFAIGDLNGDKVADYVYVAGESDSGGVITAINGKDNSVLWTHSAITDLAWGRSYSLAIGDIDNNGTAELLVGTDYLYDGRVYLLEGKSGKYDSKVIELEDGSPIMELVIADVDNDGAKEIIAGAGVEHTGSPGATVHIIDGATFTFKRSLPRLATGFGDITSMELVKKAEAGSAAIIAALRSRVYLLDPSNNSLSATQAEYTAIAVAGTKLLATTNKGQLHSIAADGTSTLVANLCVSTINAIEAINIDQIAFVCEQQLGVYDLNSKETTWQSTKVNASLGALDSLVFGQIGDKEVLMAGGNALYFFTRNK